MYQGKKRLPAKYHEWEAKYSEARSISDRLVCLDGMLLSVPKDDAFNKMRAYLNKRVKDLKAKSERDKLREEGFKQLTFNKDLPTIGLVGYTNSGKTALINQLCKTNHSSTILQFETKRPIIGVLEHEGVKIQLIEVPSTLEPKDIQLLRNVNLVLMLKDDLSSLLKKYDIRVRAVMISDIPSKEELWLMLDMIRVYSPGSREPTLLPKGSAVRDFVLKLRSNWLKLFVSAKVTGQSAKYPKQEVSLNHILKDKDLVELKLKNV